MARGKKTKPARRFKFTELSLRNLKTDLPREDVFAAELPGAGVTVTLAGGKTFFIFYRVKGQTDLRRYSFGDHGSSTRKGQARYLTVSEFVADYGTFRGYTMSRRDPLTTEGSPFFQTGRVPIPPVEAPKLTLAELLADFLDKSTRKGKHDIRTTVEKHFAHLLDRIAESITESDFAPVFLKLRASYAANTIRSYKKMLVAVFSHGQLHHGLKSNPASAIKLHDLKSAGTKDTFLQDTELKAFFGELSGLDDKQRDCLTLMLASLSRTSEAAAIEAKDILMVDGQRVWKLGDTKNGRPFMVPLVGIIGEVIDRRLAAVGGKGRLFWKFKKYPEQLKKRETGLETMNRVYALRKAGRSYLSKMGVNQDVAELLLNHTREGLKKTYDLWDFWPERVAALTLWSEKLNALRDSSEQQEEAA